MLKAQNTANNGGVEKVPGRKMSEPEGLRFNSPGQRPGCWGPPTWSPEGAIQTFVSKGSRPFRASVLFVNPVPRASPWAREFEPFGLSKGALTLFQQLHATRF